MTDGTYEITLDGENRFVLVTARGEFCKEMGEEMITKARKMAADTQHPILCDCRGVTVKVAFADWFYLPRTLPIFKDPRMRGISTALLISQGGHEKSFRFYETVTHNLGMSVRVFQDEKEAIEWLLHT